MNTIIDTPLRNLSEARAHVGLSQNMYDKLKELIGKGIDEAMTAYGEAKCISVPQVKRMLKNSYCRAFMEDVGFHHINKIARNNGMQPPYPWSPRHIHTLGFDILIEFYREGAEEFCEKFFSKGEVFA